MKFTAQRVAEHVGIHSSRDKKTGNQSLTKEIIKAALLPEDGLIAEKFFLSGGGTLASGSSLALFTLFGFFLFSFQFGGFCF